MCCVPATSVHACFPPTHLSGQTHVCKWGSPASQRVASERAKRTLWLVAATKLCLSAASWSLVWAAAIRSHAEIIGNADRNNLQSLILCNKDTHFTISSPVSTFVSMALSTTLKHKFQKLFLQLVVHATVCN